MSQDVTDRSCRLLEAGVQAQTGQDFVNFGAVFDSFEVEYGTYHGEKEAWVHYIRYCVDCWIDAANHEWHCHEPVCKDDWIPLAEAMLKSVRKDCEFNPPLLRGFRLNKI